MNIHEYQGKAVLKSFGAPVPRGFPAFTTEEAIDAAAIALIRFKANLLLVLAACALAGLAAHASGL